MKKGCIQAAATGFRDTPFLLVFIPRPSDSGGVACMSCGSVLYPQSSLRHRYEVWDVIIH